MTYIYIYIYILWCGHYTVRFRNTAFSQSKLTILFSEGVYEMRQHTVLPGKLEQFSIRFEQGVEDRNKYSQMIGIWYSEFGTLNQGTHGSLPLTGPLRGTRMPGSKY